MNEKLINKFGYGEMYEWLLYPGDTNKFGRFVQFNEIEPDKINLVRNDKNIIGVSSINYVLTSDDPTEWHKKYMLNSVGDIYMQKERLSVGNKVYDQVEEFSYIRTFPYEQYIPIESNEFNKQLKYAKRSARSEWVNVVVHGKAIVEDNGNCVPGQYCKPQFSDVFEDAGKAVPADENDDIKYYVIKRVTDTSILIFVK